MGIPMIDAITTFFAWSSFMLISFFITIAWWGLKE